MREVSEKEFYRPIFDKGLDVHPTIVSGFPYTSEWRFPRQIGTPLYGKTVDRVEGGRIRTSYFIAESSK